MWITMNNVQKKMNIPFSISWKIEDYYKDGNGRGFWIGNGNHFYNFELFLSEYSPDYDVNCIHN